MVEVVVGSDGAPRSEEEAAAAMTAASTSADRVPRRRQRRSKPPFSLHSEGSTRRIPHTTAPARHHIVHTSHPVSSSLTFVL